MSTPRQSAPSDRRDEILDAALDCFVTHGYHGTAVPTVAKRAGVAAGTLYHYFPSKEVMVNALFRKWKGVIARRVFAGFPAGAHPREQFRAMWREMVDFALAHPKAFAFLELHHHASYLDATSQGMENSLKSFGAAMVERAQSEGLLKPGPPALLMELVFGAFIGMMRAHGEGRVALTEDEQLLAEQACWDAVALHPRPSDPV